MTPESPPNPRAELEAQVTAWLLGELSTAEAARVREMVEQDTELGKLRDRLSQTLNLLRETVATPIGETPAQPAPMKLSAEKREKLLASFKTIAPREFEEKPRRIFTWPVILAAAASIALLVAVTIPNFVRARTTSQKNAIVNTLRLFDSAKQQWALDQKQSADATPTFDDLRSYFGHGGGGEPPAVEGEKYSLGPVGQPPIAVYNGKIVTLPSAPETSVAINEPASASAASAPPRQTRELFKKDKNYALLTPPTLTPIAPPPSVELPHDQENTLADASGTIASRNRRIANHQISSSEIDRTFAGGGGGALAGALPTGASIPVEAGISGEVDKLGVDNTKNDGLRSETKTEGFASATQEESKVSGLTQDFGGVNRDAKKASGTTDAPLPRTALPVPAPQVEVLTRTNAFTTFSLNVSDVAFKLAGASLGNGQMPDPAGMRSEEFINAFDYRDPEPAPGAPVGFAWERAADPFAQGRDFLRFSIKTAALGREAGRPLNLVLLLDKSGSMERADRVEIIANALRVLASQLQPHDTISVVVFARTARLFIDGVPGSEAGKIARQLRDLTPEGGTNLEEAMKLAYATALRHYLAGGENRVVLLTDGAANLGTVDPETLKKNAAANRTQGIALDCFGVGWDGYNDDLLEKLSRAGGGRYGFVNTPEEAATEFAGKLAGALRVAAADVKVQVEFNPTRVTAYRQIGYAKDQLKKEDFRDNNVRAASIGAAESGNALYTVQINSAGEGPVCTVHVRFRVPGTDDYQEHEWTVPDDGSAVSLERAAPSMRLAASAAAFSEWLSGSRYAAEVTPDRLLHYLRGVPRIYGADPRPEKLEWMVRQAKSISGR